MKGCHNKDYPESYFTWQNGSKTLFQDGNRNTAVWYAVNRAGGFPDLNSVQRYKDTMFGSRNSILLNIKCFVYIQGCLWNTVIKVFILHSVLSLALVQG